MATYDAIVQSSGPLVTTRTGIADVRVNLRRRLFLWEAWGLVSGGSMIWVSESPKEAPPPGYGVPIILQAWE